MDSQHIGIAPACDFQRLPASLRCDQERAIVLLFEKRLEVV
jgi:hypothetical protein